MFTGELEYIISCDDAMSRMVLGVYAANSLPTSNFSKRVGLIANTDEATSPGKHWVSLFIPAKGLPEFFDPLAYKPTHIHSYFEDFLVNRGPAYKYNTQKVQSDSSSNCGLFCIYFLYMRSRNIPFQDILRSFSPNLDENDSKAIDLIKQSIFSK